MPFCHVLSSLFSTCVQRDLALIRCAPQVCATSWCKPSARGDLCEFVVFDHLLEPELIKLLILAANPRDTDPLRLGQEVRMIESKIRSSSGASDFEIRSAWAVTADELMYQLNSFKPNIIHFIGHGEAGGEIVLEDESGRSRPVAPDALKAVFANFRQWLQVVVLNACYSATQMQSLTEQVDAVIGMRDAVGDDAAIEFSASFYRAISFSRTVQDAFDQAVGSLLIAGMPDDRTPVLTHRTGVDPEKLTLVGASDLATAIRRATDPRVPEGQRTLLGDGAELIVVVDEAVHINMRNSAEDNRIFLTLRMRRSGAVFIIEANRFAKLSEVSEYVAGRLLPTEARHYEWTFVKTDKALPGDLSLTMAGLKTGDNVLLTGKHRLPSWSPLRRSMREHPDA